MSIESPRTRAFRLTNEPLYEERYNELVAKARAEGKEPPISFRDWTLELVNKGVDSKISPHREPSQFFTVTESAFFDSYRSEKVSAGHAQTLRLEGGSAISPDRIAASRASGSQERG